MTDAQQPVAGWYADPETPGRLRFWDGSAWVAPTAPVAFVRALDRPFARLSQLVELGLILVVLASLAKAAVDAWGLSIFGEVLAQGDVDRARRFDHLDHLCAIAGLVGVAVTGISWLAWQHRLASSTPSGALRREPGMQVASWFIPFANLVLPFQNIRELWRYVGRPPSPLVGWWWATFLASGLIARIASTSDSPDALDKLNGAAITDLVAVAVRIVAAVLAAVIVRSLTLGGLERSAAFTRAGSPSA